ncbi:MAG: hypothetical protein ACREGI_04235 [Candidatus Levyibacteriota bacterium]
MKSGFCFTFFLLLGTLTSDMDKSFRDRFILTELHRDEKRMFIGFVVVGIILLTLLGNTVYLTFFSSKKEPRSQLQQALSTPTANPTTTVIPSPVIPTEKPVFQSSPNAEPLVKEYFISFGLGGNHASDWADVPGAQAKIDFGNYQQVKSITFETSVNVPTNNETVSVRLYNKTDNHPVWYSEVTTTSDVFVSSQPIVYDTGTKVYQVQMKTQLVAPANITLARLHIILQ